MSYYIKEHKIEGAIFDIDGTILDSMSIWENVTDKFYTSHGLTLLSEESVMFQNMTLEESLPYIKNKYNLDMTLAEMADELKGMIGYAYESEIPAKPYVVEYIKYLKKKGIKIAIATSGYPEFGKSAFKRIGIYNCIDAYALSSEVGVNKTNPDVYLLAAERINISPEKCVVFEDILAGINGANKADFITCGVYDDSNAAESENLKKAADIYISSWKELMPY